MIYIRPLDFIVTAVAARLRPLPGHTSAVHHVRRPERMEGSDDGQQQPTGDADQQTAMSQQPQNSPEARTSPQTQPTLPQTTLLCTKYTVVCFA